MKKIKISFLISLIINTICFAINIISAYVYNNVPLGKEIPGGDCIEYIGFGVGLLKIFPMTYGEKMKTESRIFFSPISLIISIILIFIITLTITTIISKIKGGKHDRN